MSTATPSTKVRRALVVTAHPDAVDFGAAGDDITETRRAELGVRSVTFLDHPDGAVVASIQLRRAISRVIRQVRPHPDHRAVGMAAFAAPRAHVSQVGENPDLEERMRPLFTAVTGKYGLPDGHLAEEFQVVDTSRPVIGRRHRVTTG